MAERLVARVAAKDSADRARTAGAVKRWTIRIVVAVVAIAVLWALFQVAVRIITTTWWFDSVRDGSVYTTMLQAEILLFVIFGAIAGLIGGGSIIALRRLRSPLPVDQDYDTFRWAFRKYEPRVAPLLVLVLIVAPGILVGKAAASYWQTYLLWRHAVPWHQADPLFGKDISYFVDVYPFHLAVVSLLSQAVVYGLWIAVIGGYWYGGWRLRRGKQKVARGYVTLLSVLLGGYVLLKAAGYWLSRYAVTTSGRGPVTGPSYTDQHATLPARDVLVVLAILCAAALLINAVRIRRTRMVVAALGVMVIAAPVIGSGWPAAVYRLQEAPSAAQVDLGEIADNQHATLAAFGLDGDVTTVPYHAPASASAAAVERLASTTAQIPLIDPNQLSPTFTVKQQLQAYYGFKNTLDVGQYDIGGQPQDVDIAARELNLAGIPDNSWVNDHLVYTHGYGVVAAPTTSMDPQTESPVFLDAGMPPTQQIPVTRPQIYYGLAFGGWTSYAIVGEPAGSQHHLEFDHPSGNGSSKSALTTYHGGGGIPIGSAIRRLLFAFRLGSSSIFFSSEINSGSQLLMVRNPAARVEAVAPWLTLDGDVYPAVVGGDIDWIVDAYTTASTYPDSQSVNLHTATQTTLTADGASVAQPSTNVNYMRNSVKAVVDAYTGKVTLYAWNQQQQPDPLLQAWESVYPGLVRPQSSIPPALLAQLRYPTDLFNVQRYLLADYHVTGPSAFYSGDDFWKVPTDPTVAAASTINGGSSSNSSSPPQPSEYISMSADGFGAQQFSLSSPMVTLNGRDLAGFIYVNAHPGPDYGKFTVLALPSSAGDQSPSQVENDIESDTKITEALTLQRGGDSRVVLGDLEAIPVAGRILYVEPVYTQSSGSQSFPVLRHVIALYADGDPSFDDTLPAALQDAIQSAIGTG